MPVSHGENICSHEEELHGHTSAVPGLVWEEKEIMINNSISFTSGFSLFRFPSHLDFLSLFCLISFSFYLTALLSSSTSLLFATFFPFHRSFPSHCPTLRHSFTTSHLHVPLSLSSSSLKKCLRINFSERFNKAIF